MTFKTLVDLIDAKVLGGQAGMDKKLDKFVIGAMTPAAMRPYITRNSLMIVGNREDAQRLALEDGAAVLITGDSKLARQLSPWRMISSCLCCKLLMILLQLQP